MPSDWRPWSQAWRDALYGPRGFYRRTEGPRGHFETAANAGGGVKELLAEALIELARRHGCTQLIDLGAGRGELITAMNATVAADDSLATIGLIGVDVVARPPGLPDRIGWLESPGGADLPDELAQLAELSDTLIVAHEWLDVVPLDVLELDAHAEPRVVLVDGDGAERLGPPADADQLAWCERWWPITGDGAAPGRRIEVGSNRDRAWTDLVGRLTTGVCVAVDYGHVSTDRPEAGTLTGYRAGQRVVPVPDGSCDLTAHVAFDSLGADVVLRQREALHELGLSGARPALDGDPAAYPGDLARATAAATLLDPTGWGGFSWAVQTVPTLQMAQRS